jgi:hypothetical protein
MVSISDLINPETWGLTINDVTKPGANGEALLSPAKAAKAILKKMPIVLVGPPKIGYSGPTYQFQLYPGVSSDNNKRHGDVKMLISLILDELAGDSATDKAIGDVINRMYRRLRFQDEFERLDECSQLANEIEMLRED